jgi:serine/threonine protein kinase
VTSSSGTGNNVSRTPGYDLQPGQIVLNTWEVLEPLGRGGMGAVYRVYHRFLQKEMAMKTLRPDQVTDVNWKRFQTEAKAIAKLVHPNIIQIFDMGTAEDGQPFYTMELLNGQGLDEWIRYEPITAAQAVTVFRQVASALAFAHERGIVHRDIKPANIVLTFAEENKPPVVKVVDFGIAKLGTENQGLTKEGEVFGSPLYMSPEQATGQKVDHRSDIYSFGCALYETLTGFPPFKGKSAMETMMMHLEKTPLPIERARPEMKFPPGLSAIVQMMLAKDSDERYSSASQIAQDLMQIERGMGEKVAYRLQTASQMVPEPEQVQEDAVQVTQRLTNSYGGAEREEEEEEEELVPPEKEKPRKRVSVYIMGLIGLIILLGAVVAWCIPRISKSEVRPESTVVSEADVYRSSPKFRIRPTDVKRLGKPYEANYVYYIFPPESVGTISIEGDAKPIDAVGFLKMPKNFRLFFECSNYLLENPKLWDKFVDDDFYQFSFPSQACEAQSEVERHRILSVACDAGLALLKNHLKKIKGLDLSGVNPTAGQCEDLGRFFPALEVLKFDGGQMMNASSLKGLLASRELVRLELPNLGDNVTEILRKIVSCHKLESLSISNSRLTKVDFGYIAQLPKLTILVCRASEINIGCFQQLKILKNLSLIDLSETLCDSDNVKALGELPNLKDLCLAKDIPWSDSDKNLLVAKLGANSMSWKGSIRDRLSKTALVFERVEYVKKELSNFGIDAKDLTPPLDLK